MLVYLLFHLFLSERSVPSLLLVSKQEAKMESKLNELTQQRMDVYDRVVRLRPQTLDPDMVEEYAIEMLGHGMGNAIIVMDEPRS